MSVVVITGASAGVGRAVARRFAAEGADIALIARGPERLEAAAEDCRALGGRALPLPCDVSDAAAVERAAAQVEATFGPIDIWINAAMVTILSPFDRIAPEEFRRVTEVTYLGCVHGTMTALKRMRPRNRGHVVQVGSALAYRSIPLQSAYCGAKHAVVGFTDSIRSELIHEAAGIDISIAHLPAVNTPQFDWMRNRMPQRAQPLPPIYQPEVAAEGLHFLARNPRRELWIGRSAWKAILGQKLAPGLLDRWMARTAWSGQMSGEPRQERGDNLFHPQSGGYAAHGRFDVRATDRAPALAASKHRAAIGVALLALGAAGVGLALRGRGGR